MTPQLGPVHVQVTGTGNELVIDLPVESLPIRADDATLRVRLPENAAGIAGGLLESVSAPQAPRDPRVIRIVRVRLTRAEVIAQTIVELDEPVEVYA